MQFFFHLNIIYLLFDLLNVRVHTYNINNVQLSMFMLKLKTHICYDVIIKKIHILFTIFNYYLIKYFKPVFLFN